MLAGLINEDDLYVILFGANATGGAVAVPPFFFFFFFFSLQAKTNNTFSYVQSPRLAEAEAVARLGVILSKLEEGWTAIAVVEIGHVRIRVTALS